MQAAASAIDASGGSHFLVSLGLPEYNENNRRPTCKTPNQKSAISATTFATDNRSAKFQADSVKNEVARNTSQTKLSNANGTEPTARRNMPMAARARGIVLRANVELTSTAQLYRAAPSDRRERLDRDVSPRLYRHGIGVSSICARWRPTGDDGSSCAGLPRCASRDHPMGQTKGARGDVRYTNF